MSFIEARGLSKSYTSEERRVTVLNGVDMDVDEGEMVAIVGSSGVGKSTLMHVLGTLDVPDSGSVSFEGNDLFSLPEPGRLAFRNEAIGFVFQFHHLLPEFTALENVAMPLFIARIDDDTALRRAREILADLGLSDRVDHRPSQLSGGEQQRVAVGRALVTKPRVVLADEPTGNLDNQTSGELVEILRRLHEERGLTSVIVTHSEKVAGICDRVLYMEDGKLATGS